MKTSKNLQYSILFILSGLFSCYNPNSEVLIPEEFKNPSPDYFVHTWWHWMDNAIAKEGITRDLVSMKEQGISQATILNVSQMKEADLGIPPVIFNTPEWYDMFRWSLEEANRLGIKIGIHNCDGWATSGGPWVTPENSMKRCTWSKTIVQGGKPLKISLPEPVARNQFYRDINVLAFRSAETDNSFKKAKPIISLNGSGDITYLHDGNNNLEPFAFKPDHITGVVFYDGNPLSATDIKEGSVIDIAFNEPFLAEKLAIHFRRRFQRRPYSEVHFNAILKVSSNGKEYREIQRIVDPVLNQTQEFRFPAVKAKYYRLEIKDQNDTEKGRGLALGELELLMDHETPRYNTSISHHLEKTVTTKAGMNQDFFTDNKSPEEAVNPSEVLDISSFMDTAGILSWDPPKGNWTILRVGFTTTGHSNHPATIAGRGLEIDKMDTAALNHHFNSFTLKLLEQAGTYAGNTFKFLLIDSWECKYQNWTDQFPQEFEKRRGYSITPWLVAICGVILESPESTERFLQDYRMTIAELIEENYYHHFSRLCKKHGLESHTEVIYGGPVYPPLDILRTNRYMDMPMYEFWASGRNYNPVKTANVNVAAEAAALYGKNIVGSEAYTGYANYEETPWDLKLYGDNAYCSGINQMILHSYVHQPNERKPGMTLGPFGQSFNRHIPWWNFSSQWFTYQARIQYVLQKGVRSADLLYFIGDRLYETSISDKEIYDVPYGYSVQSCNLDILLNHSQVKDGKVILGNGMSYEIILLPGDEGIELKSLKRIAELVSQGATLMGPKPSQTLSYHNHQNNDKAFLELSDQLWGKNDPNMEESRAYGKGKVFPTSDIAAVAGSLNISPEFSSFLEGSPNLLYFHKKEGDNDIFFVVNQESQASERVCSFRVSGKYPEIWDPAYGSVSIPAEYQESDGVIHIPVNFQPRESLIFIFRKNKKKELPVRLVPEEVYRLEQFQGSLVLNDVGEMTPVEISQLKSLTEFEDPRIKYFSGVAHYSISFNVTSDIADIKPLLISPGNFNGACELRLNGELLGTTAFPGYRFDVSGLLKEKNNVLEVKVGNNYKNRIIGDYIEFGELRNVWTTSSGNQFPRKETPLQESGLIGPITFYTMK